MHDHLHPTRVPMDGRGRVEVPRTLLFCPFMLVFEFILVLYSAQFPGGGMGCVQGMGIERTSSELEASQYAPGETLPLDLQELL
jgi:hypothetical protein